MDNGHSPAQQPQQPTSTTPVDPATRTSEREDQDQARKTAREDGETVLSRSLTELGELRLSGIKHSGAATQANRYGRPRGKVINRKFWRVRLDERDLIDLAEKVQKLAARGDAEPIIEVVSADGEEVTRDSDPRLFLDRDLPEAVHSVLIVYEDRAAPASCVLLLDPDKPADLAVYGEDRGLVLQVADDITRKLRARQSWPRLTEMLHAYWWQVFAMFPASALFAGMLGLGTYNLFDWFVDALSRESPGFGETAAAGVIRTAQVVLTLLVPFIVLLLWANPLRVMLPPVQFAGRFSDPGSKQRARLALTRTLGVALAIGVVGSVIAARAFGA